MTDLVERLESALHADTSPALAPDRLAAIRRDGHRRRARRRAATVGAAALAVAVVGGVTVLVPSTSDDSSPAPAGPSPSRVVDPDGEPAPRIEASPDLPPELAALQERILDEVPGSVRSSPTQVDLPDPRVTDPDLRPRPSGYPGADGPTVGLGVPSWVDPENFPPGAWPDWLLRDWIPLRDQALSSRDPATRRLSQGLRAASGELRLGCEAGNPARTCRPVLLTRSGLTVRLADSFERAPSWLGGRGPDEVYVADPFGPTPGDAPALVVAGVAREDVTGARFVSSTGQTVEAEVDTQLAPGTAIMWAAVPGELESVVVDGEELDR